MTRVSTTQFSTFLAQMEGKLGQPVGKASPEKKMDSLNKRIGLLQESVKKIETKERRYRKGLNASRLRHMRSRKNSPLAKSKALITKFKREIGSLEGNLVSVMDNVLLRQRIGDQRHETLEHMKVINGKLAIVGSAIQKTNISAQKKLDKISTLDKSIKLEKKKRHFRTKSKEAQKSRIRVLEETKSKTEVKGLALYQNLVSLKNELHSLNMDLKEDRRFLGQLEATEEKIPKLM